MKQFLSLVLIAVSVFTASPVFARGGSSTTVSVPTTSGPCELEFVFLQNYSDANGSVFEHIYPLTNEKYPGGVNVDIVATYSSVTNVQNIFAKSICLDAGWTVKYQTVTGGFQATFMYNGTKAIEMTYAAGKTKNQEYLTRVRSKKHSLYGVFFYSRVT